MRERLTLEQAFDPRRNSLDFLRFLLAALVILSHCYPLGALGVEPLERLTNWQESFGSLAVAGFFALSGFLITRSYVQGGRLLPFLWNRCVRIFPAFWACLLLTAFVWVPCLYWLHHGVLGDFWSEYGYDAWRYVRINALLEIRQWGVPPVFDRLPYSGVLNGSLWSLSYEFRCYLAVGVAGFVGLTQRRAVVLGTFLSLWLFRLLWQRWPAVGTGLMEPVLDPLQLELAVWFLAGSVCFLYGDRILLKRRLCLLAAFATLFAAHWGFLDIVLPVTGTYLLLWSGIALPLQSFGHRGDYSYGLYIYAFPVQQTLALWGVPSLGLVPYFAFSLLCTLPLAVLSYHLIERPALRWKWRPMRATSAANSTPALWTRWQHSLAGLGMRV